LAEKSTVKWQSDVNTVTAWQTVTVCHAGKRSSKETRALKPTNTRSPLAPLTRLGVRSTANDMIPRPLFLTKMMNGSHNVVEPEETEEPPRPAPSWWFLIVKDKLYMKEDKLLQLLSANEVVGFDVETNGLDWKTQQVVGYSAAIGDTSVYVPVRHAGGGNVNKVDEFEKAIAKTISTRTKPLVGHNIKFDSHFCVNHGIELGTKILDTMIAASLIDENQMSYALSAVASRYPDIVQKQEKELYRHIADQFGCQPTRASMAHFHRLDGLDPMAHSYAEHDTMATYAVWAKQAPELYGQNLDLIYDIENRLSHVLRKMERRGFLVDPRELASVREEIEKYRIEIYSRIPLGDDLEPLNIRSNQDLQAYFRMHEITNWEFTQPTETHPEGQPSFTKDFLKQTDEGKLLLQARAFDQFRNTFLTPLEDYIYEGKIYTNFNQTQGEYGYGTKTGRLSCTRPNMQQVSKRDKMLGQLFRRIFTPRVGYTFVEFDYSQAEPRLFSHYSDEPVLIKGYNSDPPIDMHDIAAKYLGVDRNVAKNLNLGLQYTMGVAKLAKQLNVSEDTAKQMYYRWKDTFPNVSKFTKQAATVAETRGYVKTILGRRARFPDPRWAYRAANRVVQGGAADILKYKLVELDDWLVRENLEDNVRMLLNIHDAILWEIRDDLLETMIPKIKTIMENVQSPPFNLKVPFVAEYKTGKDWAQCTYG